MGELVEFSTARDGARQLAARKGELLAQARRDRRVTDLQFRIYSEDLDNVHRSTGDKFGQLWPAVSTVADHVNAHGRTVQRTRRNMQRLGYLEQVSVGGGRRAGGGAATAVYRLPGLTPAPAPPLTPAPAPPLAPAPAPPNPIEDTLSNKTSTWCSLNSARGKPPGEDLQKWMPSDADCAAARERGYSAEWIADQIERFKDHHLAKGSSFARIDPAWRNWLRRAFELDECPPELPAASSDDSTIEEVVREHLGEPGVRLLSRIGETALRHWFGASVFWNGIRDDTLHLAVTSPFLRSQLLERFEQALCSCCDVKHVEITINAPEGENA